MQVSLDGNAVEIPNPRTLGELLEGIGPLVDPSRLVTRVEVDGAAADGTDQAVLARWRLAGTEAVVIGTESPADFAAARRREIPQHLGRIAELLALVARAIGQGQEVDANRVLAAASRELGLVLELDRRLGALDRQASACADVVATVQRIGPRLTAAERDRRWPEVAQLLAEELVPALRSVPVEAA